MKIVFAGGGTGGHFYPIIAVAQKVNKIIDREHILKAKLYYFSNEPYDSKMLFENGLLFEQVNSGKMRTYFSFRNFLDIFKVFFGTINAIFKIFTIYPDVVFGKGGYASFPTVLAARILRIPVVIHESDCAPGRVNKWAGTFAQKIAISFKEAVDYFPKEKTAWVGQPVITEIEQKASRKEGIEYFNFESEIPVIFILGGSQGAELINNAVIDALPKWVEKYQIIHQTGINNFKNVSGQAEIVLLHNKHKLRYLAIPFLNPLKMKMASGAASVIISRAGSTLFEIASWGVPSILIPFTNSNANHSKKNAFAYARAGACSVVEEMNLTANILTSEIGRILEDKTNYEMMSQNAKNFYKKDAAEKIAQELIKIALSHEK